MTNVKLASISVLLALCANGYAQSAMKLANPQTLSFSAQSNFMSTTGFARWKHFQEAQKWEPEVVEEVVAESPVFGGFNWHTFLVLLRYQIREHPCARKFVLSWHIDTIGPDWRDDYMLVTIYERDRGIVYDPNTYKKAGVSSGRRPLNDELISTLLTKWQEFDGIYKKAHPNQRWASSEPTEQMLEWWREHSK